jgi:putative transposase
MARTTRLVIPGLPHHLIQRGHNSQAIFLDDEDRRQLLLVLREVAAASKVGIHAYVLMDNHFHLLATPEAQRGLSALMQALGRRYVAWFNRRHQRTGTLWGGRFKASVVDPEACFLICQRYIELNPVRAGLAQDAATYPWSSLAHHLGKVRDPLVSDHAAYWSLGNTPFEREAMYRDWLAQGVTDAQRHQVTAALAQSGILGDKAFTDRLAQLTHRQVAPRPRGRPKKEPSST